MFMFNNKKIETPTINELLDALLEARERRIKLQEARQDESVAEIRLAQLHPNKTISYKGYIIRTNHVYRLRHGTARANVEVEKLEKVITIL